MIIRHVVLYATWYHSYNLKNVKNTHGGVLLLVKLQAEAKVTVLHGCFSRFLNCAYCTKSRNASHITDFFRTLLRADSKVTTCYCDIFCTQ